MHQALYRKWRPRDFDDVCGQDHITSILKNEIETGKINHAYLFCGSRGTGKTTCAKIFAKAVNCIDYKDGRVCGKCPACISADNGSATDIIEMDAASNNGVSNIRDIREEVNYLPSELKYRVYIVDEVHMLSTSAFNALLKTLEEPPSHVIFILATTELQKLPSTIISRCQRFDFRRIPSSVIADRLDFIAAQEGFTVEREAAFSIASIAQGGMRDAISLLELCANGSPDGKVTEETVAELIGTGERDVTERAVKAVSERDFDTIFEITSKIYMSSRDMSVFLQSMIGFYRDMLVMKTSSSAKEYLDLSDARYKTLENIAEKFTIQAIVTHTKILDDAYTTMQRGATNKRLCAECALIRMCDEKLSTSVDSLAMRVSALETAVKSGVTLTSAPAQPKPVPKLMHEEKPTSIYANDLSGAAKSPMSFAEKAMQAQKSATDADHSPSAPSPSGREVRRLRQVGYYPEAMVQFGAMFPMESAFLEDGNAYADENGKIRIRVESEIAATMLLVPDVYDGLLKIFNSFENGRLDKNTLVIEAQVTVKNSFIDEIIESAQD